MQLCSRVHGEIWGLNWESSCRVRETGQGGHQEQKHLFNIWTVVVSTGQKGCLGRHQPSDLGHGDGRFMGESLSPISSPPSQVL